MAVRVIELKNADRLAKKLAALPPEMSKGLTRVIEIGAVNIHRSALRNVVDGPATGRTYKKTKPHLRTHQASAPGESPASDLGKLAESIAWGMHPDKLGADIGTNLDRGEWLELGTRHIRPRPWLLPAAEEHRGSILENLTEELNKVLGQAGA